MTRTKPQQVNFGVNDHDFQVALMGALGFSTQYIMEQTGLTNCQVNYRLGIAEIRRKDYRNGHSQEARMVLANATARLRRPLRERLVHETKG